MAEDEEAWRVPTLVQELAAAGQDQPPSRYVRHESERRPGLAGGTLVGNAADMPEPVPVIDLRRLLSCAAEGTQEAGNLRSELQSWGMFLVANHGIETSLMDDEMNASREFFHLPLEEKQKCSNLVDGKRFQVEGYGNDQVEPQDERNLASWPRHPEHFMDVLLEYTSKSKKIKCIVLRAMARLLELDDDYFLNQFRNRAPVTVRINHYLPCPRPDLVLGFKPHSDDGVLATLLVDILRDGMWYNVPTKPHALPINVGDFMEVMSNGMFRSPVHRVVASAAKERISLARFYSLDPEHEIKPAAGLLRDGQPALYKEVKTKDYMAGFYQRFARGTRVIESMKI
ncbi:hypothetical protein GQ55_4G319500 [Panicum hallii var. hallii]|uniref:Fe2OG dioxygenase domain-containing protein n=1 Tax=Panicum hallii var. hallii TaxID=1504633 RepID=A0A2T7E2B1_9POAL|nr:hypothetical protein GQ55_4G319500 [Panicum hallii var. hallii]